VAQREGLFGEDLAASLGAWQVAPGLPLITLVIGLLWDLPAIVGGAGVIISLPALFVLAGWSGTQRVWYLRLFRGKTLERGELWPMTSNFMGRFVVLGLLAGIPFALVIVPVSFAVHGAAARALVYIPFVFVLDFMGTFITPALAFTTRSSIEAIGIGWRTLWDGWPATAPYALVAPLVVIAVGQVLGRAFGGGGVVLTVFGTLLSLWFKGATAGYYLRHHRVPDSGAT